MVTQRHQALVPSICKRGLIRKKRPLRVELSERSRHGEITSDCAVGPESHHNCLPDTGTEETGYIRKRRRPRGGGDWRAVATSWGLREGSGSWKKRERLHPTPSEGWPCLYLTQPRETDSAPLASNSAKEIRGPRVCVRAATGNPSLVPLLLPSDAPRGTLRGSHGCPHLTDMTPTVTRREVARPGPKSGSLASRPALLTPGLSHPPFGGLGTSHQSTAGGSPSCRPAGTTRLKRALYVRGNSWDFASNSLALAGGTVPGSSAVLPSSCRRPHLVPQWQASHGCVPSTHQHAPPCTLDLLPPPVPSHLLLFSCNSPCPPPNPQAPPLCGGNVPTGRLRASGITSKGSFSWPQLPLNLQLPTSAPCTAKLPTSVTLHGKAPHFCPPAQQSSPPLPPCTAKLPTSAPLHGRAPHLRPLHSNT